MKISDPVPATISLTLIQGPEGPSVSLGNRRIAGSKPWGGGKVIKNWNVRISDLLKAIPSECTAPVNLEDMNKMLDAVKAQAAVIERMGRQLDALLNHCDKEQGECSVCSAIICPHKDPMHFHHDGCPSCP